MTDQEIESKVISIIATQLDTEQTIIFPDTNLRDDLSASSLDTVEIMMEIERSFSIFISDEETGKLSTVHDFAVLVQQRLRQAPPAGK